MKGILVILAIFSLSVIVKGNIFAAAAAGLQPVLLSIGAILAARDLDVQDT